MIRQEDMGKVGCVADTTSALVPVDTEEAVASGIILRSASVLSRVEMFWLTDGENRAADFQSLAERTKSGC